MPDVGARLVFPRRQAPEHSHGHVYSGGYNPECWQLSYNTVFLDAAVAEDVTIKPRYE